MSHIVDKVKDVFTRDHDGLKDVEDAPYFLPELEWVKVVKVYDGDSFHVIGKPSNATKIYKFVVRLRDIDAPELSDSQQHNRAIEVRDELSKLILNNNVKLSNIGRDKYGRILCNAMIYDFDISEWLLSKGCGYIYHGGKKKELEEPKI